MRIHHVNQDRRVKPDRRSPFAAVPLPVPVRRDGHRRPPLEARTNWDPWLPANQAYPEVRAPLRVLAAVLLVLLALQCLGALLAMMIA